VPSGAGFEAAAVGDLDADGVVSVFAQTGSIEANGNLTVQSTVYVENELE
jgi:hypothetical protein